MARMFVKNSEIGITKEDLINALNVWFHHKAYRNSNMAPNNDSIDDVTLHPNNKYVARLKLNQDKAREQQ